MRKNCKRLSFYGVMIFFSTTTYLYILSISHTCYNQDRNLYTFERSQLEKEKRHIAFLKVHKAASSTIQNIFLRFGLSRNLTFVVPSTQNLYNNVISTNDTVNNNNTRKHPPRRPFDILCMHVLYNRTAFERILPNDTVYIGSLRDPFEYIVSFMEYFRTMFSSYNISGPGALTDFLENPEKHDVTIAYPELAQYGFTKNRFAIEFGFPINLVVDFNKEEVEKYVKNLDKEFTLVLIVEHFDESVILMKRLLRWTIKDVLYIRKNDVLDPFLVIGEKDRLRYRALSPVDYILYQHFYLRLWEQIKHEVRFHEEVLYFKTVRKNIKEHCVNMVDNSSDFNVEKSEWTEHFIVTKAECEYLLMGELTFVSIITKRQYGN